MKRLNVEQAFFLFCFTYVYVLLNRLHCENTSTFLCISFNQFRGRWQIFVIKGLLAGVDWQTRGLDELLITTAGLFFHLTRVTASQRDYYFTVNFNCDA